MTITPLVSAITNEEMILDPQQRIKDHCAKIIERKALSVAQGSFEKAPIPRKLLRPLLKEPKYTRFCWPYDGSDTPPGSTFFSPAGTPK